MNLPKLIILDRDGVLNYHSKDPASPLYYVTKPEHVVIKPGVREAIALIKAHGIPVVLATRQRCIEKGLASHADVEEVNCATGISFNRTYVQPSGADKTDTFKNILSDYSYIAPEDMAMFDDSPTERAAAASFGIVAFDGIDLLESVKKALGVA